MDEADAVLLTKRWVLEDTYLVYLPVFIKNLQDLGKAVAIGGNTVEYSPNPPDTLRKIAKREQISPETVGALLQTFRKKDVLETNSALKRIASEMAVPPTSKRPSICVIAKGQSALL